MTSSTPPSPPVEADIVARLRAEGGNAMRQHLSLGMHKLCTEAADEIERLGDVILRGSDLHLDLASRLTGLEALLVDAQKEIEALKRDNEQTRSENQRLRAALAQSKDACVYCQLPAEDIAKCASGFPGCARADDIVGCPEFGAAMMAMDLVAALRPFAEAYRKTGYKGDWYATAAKVKVEDFARAAELVPEETT